MSKCIGGIAHEAVGLATHQPSKSFGDLFEEKKAQLESLQAGLARAVPPKTLPKQKHTSVESLFVLRRSFLTDTHMLRCECLGGSMEARGLRLSINFSCSIRNNPYVISTKYRLGFTCKYSQWSKTDLELAREGKAPFIIKDVKYQQIQLHHSRQSAKGSLFELSASTRQKSYSSKGIHPCLPNSHPDNPVNRSSFNVDRETYWKERAEAEIQRRRVSNIGSQTIH